MAEARDKHHCTYCNIWIPGDRISIRNHEASQRHRDRTQAQYRIRTRDREHAEREEANMQRELQQVERDARARHARDMSGKQKEANAPIDVPAVGPLPRQVAQIAAKAMAPPPPPRVMAPPPPPRMAAVVQQQYAPVIAPLPQVPPPAPKRKAKPTPPPAPAPIEKSKGFYTVRGIVYLEGQFHEIKLVPKKACEVWIEALEDWRPATITNVISNPVPNTTRTVKSYDVSYRATDDKAAPAATATVASDQLRLPLTLPSEVTTDEQVGADGFIDALYSGRSAAYLAAQTPGYGEWSTVSVRIVDDEAEARARDAEIAAFEAKKKEIQIERDNEMIMEESLHADNALGAFNPWGGSYKGIALDDEVRPPSDDDVEPTAPVAFKKRARKDKGGRNTRVKHDL
ncbi:hypothetical protein ACHHYP_13113 [Achlya hypogyna]|uniref:Matrin-type domain-containing protein n=1 Tax=Achlya hypogyna TaxID=1202772 RepID=A0A1V9YG53_ACHHY|nr:hypothetical protein ACHHYP_13113 [Achlya hypogyna]